jgi:hypothetical protein
MILGQKMKSQGLNYHIALYFIGCLVVLAQKTPGCLINSSLAAFPRKPPSQGTMRRMRKGEDEPQSATNCIPPSLPEPS